MHHHDDILKLIMHIALTLLFLQTVKILVSNWSNGDNFITNKTEILAKVTPPNKDKNSNRSKIN